jgi:hypothetical protein
MIVDCNGTFDPAEYQQISSEQFEREWNRFHAATNV